MEGILTAVGDPFGRSWRYCHPCTTQSRVRYTDTPATSAGVALSELVVHGILDTQVEENNTLRNARVKRDIQSEQLYREQC